MTENYGIIAQASPGATSLTVAYTVPPGRTAVISSIVVCNHGATDKTFRVSVAKAGEGDGNKQYLVRDAPIEGNSTVSLQLGITLSAADEVRVYISATTVSFNLFGTELS
jgi:hypothetical protein